jgi:hypothetical protein
MRKEALDNHAWSGILLFHAIADWIRDIVYYSMMLRPIAENPFTAHIPTNHITALRIIDKCI